MKNKFIVFGLFISLSIFSQTASGDIELYIKDIIDNVPGDSGDDYNDPTTLQLVTWNTIIDNLLINDIINARNSASEIEYKVTEFTDTSLTPNQVFYILEKQNTSTNYWGTYVFSMNPERKNLVIQAPHIKFDTNTGKQAIYCFKNTLARAVFLSGTHRCNSSSFSSCSGTTSTCSSSSQSFRKSDMAHSVTTMFQKTTENLFTNIANSVFIQLHGFSKNSSDPYVILSNGTNETPSVDYALMLKERLLAEDNTLTFEIAHINQNWTRLVGFTNTQGRLINNSVDFCSNSAATTSGRFIHVEQEKSKLRNDETGWAKMSNALKNVFASTLSLESQEFSSISLAPIPTSGLVKIYAKNVLEVEVFNVFGKRVKIKEFKNNENTMVSLEKEPSGIYLFKIHHKKGIALKKVIRL